MINHIFSSPPLHSTPLHSTPIFCSGFLWCLLSPRSSRLRAGAGREHWAAFCFAPQSQAPPEVCGAAWSCRAHFLFQLHIFPINDEWERSGRMSLIACLRASNSHGKWRSDFLGIPAYSISKERSPKKSEDTKVLKGTFPRELGSATILLCKLGYNSPSDFGDSRVALIRTKKADAGRVAQMRRG